MNRDGMPALYRVAVIGAGTLKGKEMGELLPESSFPTADVKLLDDDESLGQLESVGEEVTFVQSVAPEHFENIDVAFFASEPEFTRKHWKMAKAAGSAIVDLSYALDEIPGCKLRAPWIEHELRQAPAAELEPAPIVVAHPAAVVIALLLLRAARAGEIRTAAVSAFEPASERGRRGMDELHEQTVNLLSFQKVPTEVFGSQVAFNLLARYGQESRPTLASIEARVLDHFQRITAGRALTPALMLLQAPIFHGHVFSIYLEMERDVAEDDLSKALAGDHIEVVRLSEEAPSNVGAAGQEQVQVLLRRDPGRAHAFWIWAAADNLRIMALSAIESAEQILLARPKGKVQ
jgi:aspartate-semialdehyde dehydrogenase